MNRKQYEEALERQNALFDAAMKSLEAMGNVSISIPEELLRAIDAACDVRPLATTKFDYPKLVRVSVTLQKGRERRCA